MKYHALLLFLKKRQNSKLSSAANYRWHFMGYDICIHNLLASDLDLMNVFFYVIGIPYWRWRTLQ